jgi:hypothetical protein
VIDGMLRRSGPGTCEICERKPATRKAKFSAQSLQSTSMPLFDEESLVSNEFEKRVCDDCLVSLQNAKNVSNLTFERL